MNGYRLSHYFPALMLFLFSYIFLRYPMIAGIMLSFIFALFGLGYSYIVFQTYQFKKHFRDNDAGFYSDLNSKGGPNLKNVTISLINRGGNWR